MQSLSLNIHAWHRLKVARWMGHRGSGTASPRGPWPARSTTSLLPSVGRLASLPILGIWWGCVPSICFTPTNCQHGCEPAPPSVLARVADPDAWVERTRSVLVSRAQLSRRPWENTVVPRIGTRPIADATTRKGVVGSLSLSGGALLSPCLRLVRHGAQRGTLGSGSICFPQSNSLLTTSSAASALTHRKRRPTDRLTAR